MPQVRIVDEAKAFSRKCNGAKKELGGIGYTPLIAGILSKILCEISRMPTAKRDETINLFHKIATRKDK
jgi:hypothetical protein